MSDTNIILNLLNAENTMTYNKLIAHAIGLNEAVAYASLIAKQAYYERNGLLDDEGYFYCTIVDLQESTTLTRDQQDKVIKKLVKLELMSYKRKGLPAKRFFKINNDVSKIKKIINEGINKNNEFKQGKNKQHTTNKIEENPQTVLRKNHKQYSGKSTNSIEENPQENNINKYTNKINIISSSSKEPQPNKQSTVQTDDSVSDEIKAVFELYNREISRNSLGCSSLEIEKIKELIAIYSVEKITNAIKVAVFQNKRSLAYIEGVLKNNNKPKNGIEGREKDDKPKRNTTKEIDWSAFD